MFFRKILYSLLFLVIITSLYVYISSKQVSVPEAVPEAVPETIVEEIISSKYSVIGKSVEDRDIVLYKFGNGENNISFIGGIHGGYEWNSVFLAYKFIDYFTANPDAIPENITVSIIPVSNPDGLFKVTGKSGRFNLSDVSLSESILADGRFNANGVDLNRNFACDWKPQSTWKNNIVSAGSEVFSEPEAKAIKNFVELEKPKTVVFWHSQASTVYSSKCNDITLPETLELMNKYSLASGYNAVASFDAYEITGAAEDWLSTIGIPSITVELTTHEAIDWEKNLAGVKAVFGHFGGV